jgi:hypothetical protein
MGTSTSAGVNKGPWQTQVPKGKYWIRVSSLFREATLEKMSPGTGIFISSEPLFKKAMKDPETAPQVHKALNEKSNDYLTAPAETLFALETSE